MVSQVGHRLYSKFTSLHSLLISVRLDIHAIDSINLSQYTRLGKTASSKSLRGFSEVVDFKLWKLQGLRMRVQCMGLS